MLKESLIELFERDLLKLKEEISLYEDEDAIWAVSGAIRNSAGNLCLHLTGNLNHFIGAALGNTGYVRDRESEFTQKNVSRSQLVSRIDETIGVVRQALSAMPAEDFDKDFPLPKHDKIVKTGYMLLHLLTHLNYHLGQVNYHRRLIS